MTRENQAQRSALLTLGLIVAALQLGGCASAPAPLATGQATQVAEHSDPASVESTYGIKIEGLHLSAAGYMVDLRYRVLDARKAAPLLDRKLKPYLLDAARSARLGVPETPVLGQIRQTSRNNVVHTDHSYFILFGNPGKALQSGDKVSLLLGAAKLTDLTVQ